MMVGWESHRMYINGRKLLYTEEKGAADRDCYLMIQRSLMLVS